VVKPVILDNGTYLVIVLVFWLTNLLSIYDRANDRLDTLRPAHMRPRLELHEIETEIDYYETETKNVLSRPHWSRDLNIPLLFQRAANDRLSSEVRRRIGSSDVQVHVHVVVDGDARHCCDVMVGHQDVIQ